MDKFYRLFHQQNSIFKTTIWVCVFLHLLTWMTSSIAMDTLPNHLLTGWNSIRIPILKKDIAYLTSDKLQGRLALEKGDELATEWIAEQFFKIGLQPGFGKHYLQPVSVIRFFPDNENTYLSLTANGKEQQWRKPDIYTEFPNNMHLQGELVFAGYGITAPELHYDDYRNINVRGKLVLIFDHEPQEMNPASIFNGTGNTYYATSRVKALNAQHHGAIAVLIAPEPNRTHPTNLERRARIKGLAIVPSMALANDELHIPVVMLTDKVANAIVGSNSLLSAWQTQIDRHLIPQSRSLPHTRMSLYEQTTKRTLGTSYNVVGLLPGSDPKLKNDTIIISAHHDHEGKNGRKIWHGADDNASGTVGVISLAEALTKNSTAADGTKLKRSVLFVVFAAEERGLLGAFYMAAHPLRSLSTTRAVLNFDMIGRNEAPSAQTEGLINIPTNTTNRLNLIGAHYSSDYAQTVANSNKWVGLNIDHRFDNEFALNTFFRSDQFPFVLHHIPAFWWFTGFHPDYHHVTDTAEKINYTKMQKILRLAYLTTYAFANEKTPPSFIKN